MLNNVNCLLPWDEIEKSAQMQIMNTALSPVLGGDIAIMPDCHWGMGATVGSVIPTYKAIIPAAVGVDIGCGMEAVKLPIDKDRLDSRMLGAIYNRFNKIIPLGAGGRTQQISSWQQQAWQELEHIRYGTPLALEKFSDKPAINQLGSLGSGNHFIELCLDENDEVWLMLHSGSRGIGNRIGTYYIEKAKEECIHKGLPDSNLSFLYDGTQYFSEYVQALTWAQAYAKYNRKVMLLECINALRHLSLFNSFLKLGDCEMAISCHHNYVEKVSEDLYLTRKGAISAKKGELGIIPGSMGAKSYLVRGLGNEKYHNSASHGAGRKMSRGEAKRTFTLADLKKQTEGVVCPQNDSVIDEIPGAYKDIDHVIALQSEVIEVVHTLKQILNVKG